MGHIILIKSSFFLCKTHFLIKLSGAALGPHSSLLGPPHYMSNKKSSSRFPLLLKLLIKILRRCRKLSDLVGRKCIEERGKWEALGCSHLSSSRPAGASASSEVSALGKKIVQVWPQSLCLPTTSPAHISSWQGVVTRAQGYCPTFPMEHLQCMDSIRQVLNNLPLVFSGNLDFNCAR